MSVLLLCSMLWAEESKTKILKPELTRNLQMLTLPDQPRPYFIGVHTRKDDFWFSRASFGALMFHQHKTKQSMTVDMRVGSAQFDNRNFSGGYSSSWASTKMPVTASADLYRRNLWLLCDDAYKNAVEEYSEKIAAFPEKDQQDGIDFLASPPVKVNKSKKVHLRDLSPMAVRLSQYMPIGLEDISVTVLDRSQDRHILSTEKTDIQLTERYSVVHMKGVRKAADGADVAAHRWWVVPSPKHLPKETVLRKEMAEMGDWLKELQLAEVEKDYLGPVIFEPKAAAEFFRQLLPSQIVGTPPSREPPSEYQASISFSTAREGRRIFEGNWKVEDLPLKTGLLGSYHYDYEGVSAQNLTLIKKGVLKDVLMSRTPREGKTASTGHGRGSVRARITAMPSNVRITPPKHYEMEEIRKKALKLSRQVGNDYVLVVRVLTPLELHDSLEIAFTGDAPLSGLSAPLEMVRLYRDGREEPVRGGKFFGVDRRIFKDIVMAGPQSSWYNVIDLPPSEMRFNIGFFGYGSSWSAPAILISEMELRGASGGEKHVIPAPY